jgi:hypothetical protein
MYIANFTIKLMGLTIRTGTFPARYSRERLAAIAARRVVFYLSARHADSGGDMMSYRDLIDGE